MSELVAVVLAAGRSRRMQSSRSKVLHHAAGRPLIHYPVGAALGAGATRVVVVTSPGDREEIGAYLDSAFVGRASTTVQDPPKGTGHAAQVGLAALAEGAEPHSRAMILCGDTPLLTAQALGRLAPAMGTAALRLGVCRLPQPAGYGRVLRSSEGRVIGVREDRDLESAQQRAIDEVNAGLYGAPLSALLDSLQGLSSDNAQGELYLTDIIARFAAAAGVEAIELGAEVIVGVNDRVQLAQAQELLRARIIDRHRRAGASVSSNACIDDAVTLERDVIVRDGVQLRGETRISENAVIDVGCVVEDSELGPGAQLLPYTVVSGAKLEAETRAGPFTHLRPGTTLERDVKLGNFVEVKNSHLREGVKAGHLAYLGDGDIGAGSNIGAGTIFCNYDGFSKQRTILGENVFVGSDSQFVAPVRVGDGAYIATATTVTDDVPSNALAIGRCRQAVKPGYASALRDRLRQAREAAEAAAPSGPTRPRR